MSPSSRTVAPSVHPAEHVLAHVVDERDTRVDQQLRAEVRVAPAHADRRVHHGGHLPADQGVGGDPVQVGVVDDGDVAGAQPLGEVLRPAVQTRGSDHPGQFVGLATADIRDPYGRHLHRCSILPEPPTTRCHLGNYGVLSSVYRSNESAGLAVLLSIMRARWLVLSARRTNRRSQRVAKAGPDDAGRARAGVPDQDGAGPAGGRQIGPWPSGEAETNDMGSRAW